MFKIILIGTISLVLLLAAVSVASARGVGPTNDDYGHTFDMTSHMGRTQTSDINTIGDTTAGTTTMANHFARAADQMRVHALQVETANHMQQTTGMEPGYYMQPGDTGTGTGYMDPGYMDPGTGYMDPGTNPGTGYMDPGTMSGNAGTGAQMGTMGTGTSPAGYGGGGSMMGR
ncbi:MAG: hypothetical protein ACYC6O_08810 [Thermoleophilia bacterium]